MNRHTHRTIYNHSRGCLMAVAETAKSSGKASGGARPCRTSKSKTPTCRKARSALSSGDKWLQANQGKGYRLPYLLGAFNSALTRKSNEGCAASQSGADPVAPLLALGNTSLAVGVSPQLFPASQSAGKASGTYNTYDETVKGSSLASNGSLSVTAVKDLAVVGSNIQAAGNARLAAGGNVTIAAERETHTLDAEDKGSKGGLGGKSETKTTSQNLDIIQSGVSGSNVSIASQNGNVILEAANIEAKNSLNVSAVNGAVALLSATSQSYFQQDKKESNVAIQRMSGSGTYDKTVVTTQLRYGTLSIDANKIIADLPASKAADELAKQPGMGWITDIKNDPALAGKIDWKQIDEAHKSWAYDKTTMTPAMASLVTIALAVATGGTGATLVGATSAIGGAVASAAFTSLVTQATIGLINNGGDLSKTLEQMGSSESIRGLVTSMATAAAMSYVSNMDFMKDMTTDKLTGQPIKFADLEFTQKLGVSVTNAATGAVTRTALNGGSLGDALVTAIGSGFTTALAAQGANALHLSPDQQGDLMAQVGNKLGHALIGCAAAKANSGGNNCQAGAMGAVIGEIAAEMLAKTPQEVDAMNAKERQGYESSLVNTTKLISASIAAAAGLDPNAAAVASANAVENNKLKSITITKTTFDKNKNTVVGTIEAVEDKGDGKTEVKSFPITTGRGTNDSSVKDKGPTPSGTYTINPAKLQNMSILDRMFGRDQGENELGASFIKKSLEDWGTFRIPLIPNAETNTFGRTDMYLHGGSAPGSAGCVDCGSGTSADWLKNQIRDTKMPIPVIVK